MTLKMCCFFWCFFNKRRNEESLIGSIKLVKFRSAGSFRKAICGNEKCTICLEEFEKDEEIQLTPCNHGYHIECLENWLSVKSNCPMCQSRLKNEHCDENTPLIRSWSIEI